MSSVQCFDVAGMTAPQRIKSILLSRAMEDGVFIPEDMPDVLDSSNVDDLWDEFEETGEHWDFLNEFRDRADKVVTDIECGYNRHYECKSVAARLDGGVWVGWDFWFGGGKFGEPESMPWIDDAYYLKVTEEQKVVTVRTFEKVE